MERGDCVRVLPGASVRVHSLVDTIKEARHPASKAGERPRLKPFYENSAASLPRIRERSLVVKL